MNWELIWREHGREIFAYVYTRVRNKEEAEDLTQEVFVKAIRSGERYQEGSVNVVALLKTIAKNLIIDKWRTKGTAQIFPLSEEAGNHSSSENVEKLIEEKDEIKRALSILNEDQLKVVTCRLIQGHSVKETAALLGKNESTVKVIQFRAIEKMKNKLHQMPAGRDQ
ncbi:RNA polymerase sigma factor [Falsibacillus pallidus]|uniref:RNA polymerase sigma-70 factor (ECF subfamily) n=1 Tax=Falsibacillus pallidus TaxID=493781 RepID=A0A370GPU6_9BACI|nr:RNA polymerase sigma factor [Falsibacillus pallidus]RDI45742.1 RNA polymerase sigma-70 factor (ECF subfamily) [Falsibacillus pallidus]